jgi:preprotein translocase subunit YajC
MIALLYLGILVVAFLLLIVRPQRRQMAAHRALVATLRVGDDVVTSGGIYGTIQSLDEEAVELEVAPGVVLRVARGAIAQRVGPVEEPVDDTIDETGDDRPES